MESGHKRIGISSFKVRLSFKMHFCKFLWGKCRKTWVSTIKYLLGVTKRLWFFFSKRQSSIKHTHRCTNLSSCVCLWFVQLANQTFSDPLKCNSYPTEWSWWQESGWRDVEEMVGEWKELEVQFPSAFCAQCKLKTEEDVV